LKRLIRKPLNLIGFDIIRISNTSGFLTPEKSFLSYHYQRHNQRRLEHLASLGLNINGLTVLEVGAGIGDHTSFFLDRDCRIVTSDARPENIKFLRSRYPDVTILHLDLDSPPIAFDSVFDIVYCYGLLYHLKNPTRAIEFMANCCQRVLLLETCVSFGDEVLLNPCSENAANPAQAISGMGCRPTRRWVYNHLNTYFEFVYLPITQPNHEEFPIDWTSPPPNKMLTRSIFIASRQRIVNALLTQEIPMQQKRH
jgi:ubiquinone/menaquinone biosynthesis C-methylase UbiE